MKFGFFDMGVQMGQDYKFGNEAEPQGPDIEVYGAFLSPPKQSGVHQNDVRLHQITFIFFD